MSRVMLPLWMFVLGVLAAGCSSTGIGDPCNPAHPSQAAGQSSCAEDAGCFNGGEIYIETRSLQCRTRVCMVYRWDEFSNRDQHSQRVFCTCRCGGEGDPTSYCLCPHDTFTCTTAFVAGAAGIRGSYCVRNEALGIVTDAGP